MQCPICGNKAVTKTNKKHFCHACGIEFRQEKDAIHIFRVAPGKFMDRLLKIMEEENIHPVIATFLAGMSFTCLRLLEHPNEEVARAGLDILFGIMINLKKT